MPLKFSLRTFKVKKNDQAENVIRKKYSSSAPEDRIGMAIAFWLMLEVAFYLDVADGHDHHHHPRVIITETDCVVRKYVLPGTHSRMELLQGPKHRTVYAGGGGRLFYLDFREHDGLKEMLVFRNNCSSSCSRNTNSCDYDITLLHEHKNGSALFICGTNGMTPVCCSASRETGFCHECHHAKAVAPVSVHERAPSLYLGEELYTTANMVNGDNHVGIRRHFGHRASIWPSENVTEENYVALVASPRPNKIQDRIYAFLSQRNADQHREADLWVSLVTQVCQADLGGPKSFLQRSWTSHLSALLSCGIAEKKLYFNQLLDVAVLEQDNWKDSMVYALFSNGWGMTAVCIFTMGDIDYVFTNSPFKGYTGTAPHPRPGTCVHDSTKLPQDVLRLVKDHPKMKDWVRPMNNSDPVVISHHQYKHIRVDRVNTSLGASYNVILLMLGSGRVHKVLEHASHAFIIAELRPFASRCHIRNVLLQPHTKMLYVSCSREVVELDLRSCQAYGSQCEDCVMARDPYCGWNGTHCAPVTSSAIQDVKHGNPQLCTTKVYGMPSIPRKVKQHTPHFLSCPMKSTHATYIWYHNGITVKSLVTDSQCLLLIEAMDTSMAGTYRCNASEMNYTKVVVEYKLSVESKAQGLAPTYLLLYLLSHILSSMLPQDL